MTDHPQYVLVWCQRYNNRHDTLLILKDRPEWQKGRLNLPGGKIEEGENPEQAALRELEEETGYKGSTIRCMGILQDGPFRVFCMKSVITSMDPPQPKEGETEVPAWHSWFDAETDKRLMPNLRVIIPLMRCGVSGWRIGDTYRSEEKKLHTIKIAIPTHWD